jgi:AcrR family transcriptional regulator
VKADDAVSQRLPRGPHRLTREQVVQSQRSRMLRAMAEVMAEKGYAATSVTDVLRKARVSRETFYQQFSSKEDCFMGAFEAAVETVLDRARATPPQKGSPLERFGRGLRAYLDALASQPAFARLFLIEVYAAGPNVVELRTILQQRFADTVNELFGARSAADRFANEALVAAIGAMVTARIAAGDLDGLRALHRPVMQYARRTQGGRSER